MRPDYRQLWDEFFKDEYETTHNNQQEENERPELECLEFELRPLTTKSTGPVPQAPE
jgi:hypothetical protein